MRRQDPEDVHATATWERSTLDWIMASACVASDKSSGYAGTLASHSMRGGRGPIRSIACANDRQTASFTGRSAYRSKAVHSSRPPRDCDRRGESPERDPADTLQCTAPGSSRVSSNSRDVGDVEQQPAPGATNDLRDKVDLRHRTFGEDDVSRGALQEHLAT